MSAGHPFTTTRRDEGVALILALLFVVLLAAMVVTFSYETQVDGAHAQSTLAALEAFSAARSGIAMGMSLLAADLLEDEYSGLEPHDSLLDIWAQGIPFQAVNESLVQVRVADEFGKIPVNYLVDPVTLQYREGDIVAEGIERALVYLFDQREAEGQMIVDALIDWMDREGEGSEAVRGDGAEDEYYMGLEIPYAPKNGPMDSIEELLLIRGITPEVFFGDPELEQVPLSELLTVHGHPLGAINPNTAPFEVLDAMLPESGSSLQADDVLADREQAPYMNDQELESRGIIVPQEPVDASRGPAQPKQRRGNLLGTGGIVNPEQQEPSQQQGGGEPQNPGVFWTVESQVFRIYGNGLSDRMKVRVEAYVWRNPQPGSEFGDFRLIDWRVIR